MINMLRLFIGISWLTIGETIYPDGEHYIVSGYKAIKQLLPDSIINSKK